MRLSVIAIVLILLGGCAIVPLAPYNAYGPSYAPSYYRPADNGYYSYGYHAPQYSGYYRTPYPSYYGYGYYGPRYGGYYEGRGYRKQNDYGYRR
jgi:hypothetical protein